MARYKVDDINIFGPQNADKLQAILSQPLSPLLHGEPSDLPIVREEVVQAQTIAELASRGYRVLQASVRYKLIRCPACGHCFHNHADTGQTPGISDLLVRNDRWPVKAVWLGLEIKGAKTRLSKAQSELLAVEGIEVARTPAQALRIAESMDERMGQFNG